MAKGPSLAPARSAARPHAVRRLMPLAQRDRHAALDLIAVASLIAGILRAYSIVLGGTARRLLRSTQEISKTWQKPIPPVATAASAAA